MRFIAHIPLTFKTSSGEIRIEEGKTFEPQNLDAVKDLLIEGVIEPVEKAAYRIYSALFGSFLWIVDNKEDINALREKGIKEVIYTFDEIKKLRSLDEDILKEIHKVKEVFEMSKIEGIKKRNEIQENRLN